MTQREYRTICAFHGDPAANQLSFHDGAIILVQSCNSTNNGWSHGTLLGSKQSGWFPSSYVVVANGSGAPVVPLVPALPIAAQPIYATPVADPITMAGSSTQGFADSSTTLPWATPTAHTTHDDGFFGAPMGGQAVATTADSNTAATVQDNQSWSASSISSSLSSGATKAGSALSRGASKTGSAISSGATKTGSALSSGANKTGKFFKRGFKNSTSVGGGGRSAASPPKTSTTVATKTTTTRSGFLRNKETETETTTTTTVAHSGGPRERSSGERTAGLVGRVATWNAVSNLVRGNVSGAVRGGAVAGTAIAVEGNLAAKNTQSRY
jgi:hypothetical protein